jgi:hypothetical protein
MDTDPTVVGKHVIHAADLMTPEDRLNRIVELLSIAAIRLIEDERAGKKSTEAALPLKVVSSEVVSDDNSLEEAPRGR